MNESNQFKAIAMLMAMIIEADQFHLSVAKALLSDEPLSPQQRAALRTQVAKRETRHEGQDHLLNELERLLKGGAGPSA